MALKRVFGRFLALLILGCALLFGMSGIYHEAPWILAPLIGSAKVELGGKPVSTNIDTLSCQISKREVPLLAYFTKLRSADLRGSDCYREIAEWAGMHPEVDVAYTVPLPGGRSVDSSVKELDLSWLGSEDVPSLWDSLPYLPHISTVRLAEVGGGRLSVQDMEMIRSVLKDAQFDFSATIGDKTVNGETVNLDLSNVRYGDPRELAVILSCMKNLSSVDLGSEQTRSIPWEDIALFKSHCPDVHFQYRFMLYGKAVDLDTEKLDYRGMTLPDHGDILFSVLSCMNRCSYIDLDNTGVPNSSLEALRERFPDTKFVWRVWFGNNYSVRTDAERILASKPSVGGMIYDASVLKYCTDIKYLDLGHNDELADLSFVRSMPKLEVLIIAMTGITDLSPLRDCPNLEYLEIFSTNVSDLSPLQACTGLHHLNIADCPNIKDISPLYGLTALERLWIGCNTPVPAEQVKAMSAAVPGCKINTTTEDPHGEAWRYSAYDPEEPKYYWVPRHELLREQLGYNYQEYSFYWLDPYCDKEAPEEYRGMFGKEVYGK